jgi:putative ABC transport system permease protein
MLWNYLAAAIRNLMRNKLYAAIGIFGLAVGLAAALAAGLTLRQELTHDRFISGHENLYLVLSKLIPEGRPPDYNRASHNSVAGLLRSRFTQVRAVTRLADATAELRRGDVHGKETLYWADANAFELLPLPVRSGVLRDALRKPDSIVLTRSIARKYFGREEVVGQTLQLGNEHAMTVTAVIEDLPAASTQLQTGIFASGVSSYSELAKLDGAAARAPGDTGFQISVYTFVQMQPGASVEPIQAQMPALMNEIWPRRPPGLGASMELVRLDRLNLFPGLNPTAGARLTGTVLVGALILILACVNFVNLATARSVRRSVEVSIRKVAGAERGALIVQFLGEALLHVLLASFIAIALTEWALPYLSAFLDARVTFDYWREPEVLAALVLGALAIAIIAGLYPAFVLSAFRPAVVLQGALTRSAGTAGVIWKTLVVAQFAILIGLVIAAGVVYEQQIYATRNALRVDTDQVLIIESPCNAAFKDQLQRLPGVRGASCSSNAILTGQMFDNIRLRDGGALAISLVSLEAGTLEIYGLKPVAGRFYRAGATGESATAAAAPDDGQRYLINETAASKMGFRSAAEAVGKPIRLSHGSGEVIGVVPDFSLSSVREKINPTLYFMGPPFLNLVIVKLAGRDIPETLARIDRLWTATGASDPIRRYFVDEYLQGLYREVLREGQTFGIFSIVAVVLAALGLFGLASAITERRTKEIGIRKAMGADTGDVMLLLAWQFTKPVLWANLVAWPLSAYLMSRWLSGFAYHVDLSPWIFVAAAAIALLVAQLTVAGHCYWSARRSPVIALRTT